MIRFLFPTRWPTTAETLLMLSALLRGVWWILPWESFNATIYNPLIYIMPDDGVWGWLLVGMALLVGLGVRHGYMRLRRIIAIINILFWLFLTWMFLLADYTNTAWIQFWVCFIMAWGVLIQTKDRLGNDT